MELQGKPESQEKINPFKGPPKPKQPQLEVNKMEDPSSKKPGKEYTITIKPWKAMRGLLVLLLLLGIFFLGRWSTGADSLSMPDFSNYFSHEVGPSGLATGDTGEAKTEETKEEVVPVEKEVNTSAEEDFAAAPAEVNASESSEELTGPETFVTESYSKVALSLDEAYKDWKGTWGKITGMKYTIKNNEAGTIKPHHFIMLVEGYDTGESKIEKEFEVGIDSQRVKAGETVQDEAAVGGFSYNPKTIPDGDLKKVRITIALYDESNILMATHSRDVDLSGQ